MNIELIKTIVNSQLTAEEQEELILSVLADDEKVIPYILKILNKEREKQRNLILDMNLELNKSLFVLNRCIKEKKNKDLIEQIEFIINSIKEHYSKWKNYIKK